MPPDDHTLAATIIALEETAAPTISTVIFKRIADGRPYPDHGRSFQDWAAVPPRPIRLDELVTTKTKLDLETLLASDSTYYGDLFAHVVQWNGELYLEDGLHRAVRAALQQRPSLHARVLDLDTRGAEIPPESRSNSDGRI